MSTLMKENKPTAVDSNNAYNRIILSITLMIALINILIIIYSIGYIQGWNAMFLLGEHFESSHGSWPYSITALRGINTLFYVLCAWCLWSRMKHHLILSILTLLSVGLCYLWWYFDSLMFLRRLEVSNYSQLHLPGLKHAGGLREATSWDMFVLTITILMLLWQLRKLLKDKYFN
jgi:hypothetical protein